MRYPAVKLAPLQTAEPEKFEVKFGQNCEIWVNLVKIVKFGRNFDIVKLTGPSY